ncbi:precorrin-6A synthase (deacetylating) [Nocardioides sp.]|uniref:precorrin-6A synthase (deacetylating) n=1 Tax=Nocardioides sp. TaxID=35761 RepID=UPI00286B1FF8|nr:precorrin-6A synthase (deacetylating) [Nocardioides sp.]
MKRVRIVGIGMGAEHLTAEAEAAIRSADYVIAAQKSDDDRLLEARRALCRDLGVPLVAVPDPPRDRDAPADYPGAVRDWHDARAAAYEQVLAERDGDAAFLVWGDPAFYDSTIRIVEQVAERGRVSFAYDVVPGVSAPQLLAARHRLVLHEVGRPVLFTTGRRLLEDVAAGHDNLVVLLDGRLACTQLVPDDWQVWWGANLGATGERLVAGPLGAVLPEIRAARTAAAAEAGWVMDVYLLRRVRHLHPV